MPWTIDESPEKLDPQDVSVQLNVRVPFHYREQLIRMAQEKRVSLNRFVTNALVRSVPPERRSG